MERNKDKAYLEKTLNGFQVPVNTIYKVEICQIASLLDLELDKELSLAKMDLIKLLGQVIIIIKEL